MTTRFKPWGNHGPEPCDMCGVQHTPIWKVYDDEGYPIVDLNEPEYRFVKLHSITPDGVALYVEAEKPERQPVEAYDPPEGPEEPL